MTFALSIEGEALTQMVDGRRIAGTLGFSADGTLNFNAWRNKPAEQSEYIRLRHGRASVSPRRIRLFIDMDRREKLDDPISSIYSDTYDAMSFIRKEITPPEEKTSDKV